MARAESRRPRRTAVRPAPPGGWGPWLQQVFDRLYAHFGPRHWWPAETPFEVVVGAILTQNVAWVNVEKAIANLKAAGLLDPAALAAAPEEQIAALIRPSGYYRSKAKKLKAFLAHVQERYGGDLERMWQRPLDELKPEVYGIWGIGPETGDCILCYAAGKPVMAMDAYTRRVFSRLGAFEPDATYAEMQALFHGHLPADTQLYNEYHALIDGLANRICLKRRPRCGECPLAAICPRLGVEAGETSEGGVACQGGAAPPAAGAAAGEEGRLRPEPRKPSDPPMRHPSCSERVTIHFKDKKNSSGRIRDGEIVLYISSRLSRAEQQRHITILTQRLEEQFARARPAPPAGLQDLPLNDATTDAALAQWARELNARHYGFDMGRVVYRRQSSRWGSCSGRTRNIYISLRLKTAPKHLVEYVLIHELCHLAEMNHGPRFWRLVARACPDYRERRAQLQAWGRWLDAGSPSLRED